MTRRPVLPGASELFRRTDTPPEPEVTELPSLSNSEPPTAFTSMNQAAMDSDFGASSFSGFANSDDSADNDATLVRLLANRGVDGIFVVASTGADGDPALLAALEGMPVPCVMVDRLSAGVACDEVA